MLLQWFGEQSEAVKLALIGLMAGGAAGARAVWVEWRKPVLDAQPIAPPSGRAAHDDPLIMLATAVEAMNVTLAEIKSDQSHGNTASTALLEKINDELRDIRQEIVVARETMKAR